MKIFLAILLSIALYALTFGLIECAYGNYIGLSFETFLYMFFLETFGAFFLCYSCLSLIFYLLFMRFKVTAFLFYLVSTVYFSLIHHTQISIRLDLYIDNPYFYFNLARFVLAPVISSTPLFIVYWRKQKANKANASQVETGTV